VKTGLFLLAATLALSVTAVRAQSDDTLMLMNRLNDLDAQVQALKAQSGRGGSPNGPVPLAPAIGSGPVAADLDIRLQQIQDQIRSLTGEVESQGNDIAQMKTENQRMMQDMQLRLNDLEAKVGGTAPAVAEPSSPASIAGPATPPSSPQPQPSTLGTLVPGPNGAGPAAGSPEKDYETAYNLLGQGDYADAETGFRVFLARYPKQALAPNADYWLGETYYARGMMDKAAITFADTYKEYPNGAKAPDALLRLGMALGQQQKIQQACLSFAELAKQFPAASSKIKASLAQERARYKCQ
jgi:tol-pal system protein YbgF